MTAFHTSAAIGSLNADLRELPHSIQVKQLDRILTELLLGVERGPSKIRAVADAMDRRDGQ